MKTFFLSSIGIATQSVIMPMHALIIYEYADHCQHTQK